MAKVINQFEISAVFQGWDNGPFSRMSVFNGLCNLENGSAWYNRVLEAVKAGDQIAAIDYGMSLLCKGVLSGKYQDVQFKDITVTVWESNAERAAAEAEVAEIVKSEAGLSERCPVVVCIPTPKSEWIVSVTDGIMSVAAGRGRVEIIGGLNRLIAQHRMANSTISLSDLV